MLHFNHKQRVLGPPGKRAADGPTSQLERARLRAVHKHTTRTLQALRQGMAELSMRKTDGSSLGRVHGLLSNALRARSKGEFVDRAHKTSK